MLDDGDLISYEAACSHRIRNSGKTRASAGSILAAVDLSEARPVPVPSTTGFDRLLPMLGAICRCPSRSNAGSWPRNRRGSGECRLMCVSVTEAKARLSELVGRAKAGDGVVLTCHSQPEVQLVPVKRVPIDRQARQKLMEEFGRVGGRRLLLAKARREVRISYMVMRVCRGDRGRYHGVDGDFAPKGGSGSLQGHPGGQARGYDLRRNRRRGADRRCPAQRDERRDCDYDCPL